MSLIYLPGGGAVNTDKQIVQLPKTYVQALDGFADASGQFHLGLHCSLCKQDVVGDNDVQAGGRVMRCGCRVFQGRVR